jgi:putative peptidoglycan lipid II flippase
LLRKGAAVFGFSVDAAARKRLPRIALAALAMGALLWLATGLTPAGGHSLMGLIVLGLQIAGGIAAYGLFLRLFGIASWREAVNALRRPVRQDPGA